MPENKQWWQSKTVWGGLIALVAGIAGIFGFNIGAEDQQLLTESALGIVGAVGGLIAVYGRVTAKKKVGKQ